MKVELLKTHTHQGNCHPPGILLEVEETTARWLIEQKVAKPGESDNKKSAIKPEPTHKGAQ